MRLKSFISFVGFVLLIAGTYCPLLRLFHLFNWFKWDIYDLYKPYGMVILLIAVVGILGVVLNKISLVRITAWLSLLLVLVLFTGVFFKVHTSFDFLPFRSFAKFMERQIRLLWGWYVLFSGGILALAGSLGKQVKRPR